MDLVVDLPPQRDAPTQARAALAPVAGALDPRVYDDLRLVVSELVANAVVHGPGRPIRVKLAVRGRHHVVGEVEDQGTEGVLEIREAAGDHSGGFGLRILDRVSDRWGVYEGSTHVWFELRRPPLTGR